MASPRKKKEPTLNEALKKRGFTTRPSRPTKRQPSPLGRKDILYQGNVVFSGRAHEVWAWLKTPKSRKPSVSPHAKTSQRRRPNVSPRGAQRKVTSKPPKKKRLESPKKKAKKKAKSSQKNDNRYDVLRCVSGSEAPKTKSYKTLKDARVAASKAGVIRDRKTGLFVNKDLGAPKSSPPKRQKKAAAAPKSPAKTRARTVKNETAKDKLGGIIGRRTTVLTTHSACLQREPARYRLVPVSKLIPSHDGLTFRVNAKYPKGVQERRYDRDKSEQAKVIGNAQASCFEPSIVANTDPTPLGGAPIVTTTGIVLGGNSRAMVLQRVYSQDSAAAREYRAHLTADAGDWGFDAGDVAKLKQPVLVRVVASSVAERSAVRRYNETLTQSLDATAEQVATSQRIDAAVVGELDKMGDDETLTAFLQSARSKGLVTLLVRKGVITKQQVNKYIKGGRLNEDGRRFVARALVGRVMPDANALDLLFNAAPSLRENIARAVPYILTAAAVAPKWDVSNAMKDAARIYSAVRSGGHKTVDSYLAQSSLFSSGLNVTSASALLARIFLEKNGPVKLSAGFRRYASAAKGTTTRDMFAAAPAPVSALAAAFGLSVPSGPHVLSVSSFSPSAVATAKRR